METYTPPSLEKIWSRATAAAAVARCWTHENAGCLGHDGCSQLFLRDGLAAGSFLLFITFVKPRRPRKQTDQPSLPPLLQLNCSASLSLRLHRRGVHSNAARPLPPLLSPRASAVSSMSTLSSACERVCVPSGRRTASNHRSMGTISTNVLFSRWRTSR